MLGFVRQIILLLFSWQFLTMALVWHHEKVKIQSTESTLTKHITNIGTHPENYFGTEFRDKSICSVTNRGLISRDYIQLPQYQKKQQNCNRSVTCPGQWKKGTPQTSSSNITPYPCFYLCVLSNLTWVSWFDFLNTCTWNKWELPTHLAGLVTFLYLLLPQNSVFLSICQFSFKRRATECSVSVKQMWHKSLGTSRRSKL